MPIGREVSEIPVLRHEGEYTIVPVLQEVLVVEKRLVLIEEVHIRQVVSEPKVTHLVTLLHKYPEVERIDLDKKIILEEYLRAHARNYMVVL